METVIRTEAELELTRQLNIELYEAEHLALLAKGDKKYLKDLKLNLKSIIQTETLGAKESALIGLACAINEKNKVLVVYFTETAKSNGASDEEISESIACSSLLSSNNVLYRFRHFTKKEKYQQIPARLRMSVIMNPVMGKELFELVSLAVSAVNGCEMCVNAHEHSLIEMGTGEEKIFDCIRIASVVTSLGKIIY